jgi:hypothetical protein
MGTPNAAESRMEMIKTPHAPSVLRAASHAVYLRKNLGADKFVLYKPLSHLRKLAEDWQCLSLRTS